MYEYMLVVVITMSFYNQPTVIQMPMENHKLCEEAKKEYVKEFGNPDQGNVHVRLAKCQKVRNLK